MIELYWALLFGLQSKRGKVAKKKSLALIIYLWQIVGFCLVLLLARKEATKVNVYHIAGRSNN